MKLFLMSDIHGSLHYLAKAFECYNREGADNIILLGDAMYHGPRNELPEQYNPKEVSVLLNKYKEKIIAVRGNCDSEVDAMLIDYPMMSDYSIVLFEGKKLFLTHGHIYSPENLPPLNKGDLFAYGHTHIYQAEKLNERFVLNPGSISLPKKGMPNTYGILQDNFFQIKDLNGNIIKSIEIK